MCCNVKAHDLRHRNHADLIFILPTATQAVTLGEQRGFTLEQFARIVSCYLQDSDNVFRCVVVCVRVRVPLAKSPVRRNLLGYS